MLIKTLSILLVTAAIASAQSKYPRIPVIPGPDKCPDGYITKKGCGVNGTDICCPPKVGRPVVAIDLGHLKGKISKEELAWKEENCMLPLPTTVCPGPDQFKCAYYGGCCRFGDACDAFGPYCNPPFVP
ncbi:MAG: hypothetical protein J3Q66DRAFT_373689 [Benniella sp.]|nr:MAG: hypothetical protein J3Q66DRAFT_373689 [Benniella sp.]